jgi:hypothetical protein
VDQAAPAASPAIRRIIRQAAPGGPTMPVPRPGRRSPPNPALRFEARDQRRLAWSRLRFKRTVPTYRALRNQAVAVIVPPKGRRAVIVGARQACAVHLARRGWNVLGLRRDLREVPDELEAHGSSIGSWIAPSAARSPALSPVIQTWSSTWSLTTPSTARSSSTRKRGWDRSSQCRAPRFTPMRADGRSTSRTTSRASPPSQ